MQLKTKHTHTGRKRAVRVDYDTAVVDTFSNPRLTLTNPGEQAL